MSHLRARVCQLWWQGDIHAQDLSVLGHRYFSRLGRPKFLSHQHYERYSPKLPEERVPIIIHSAIKKTDMAHDKNHKGSLTFAPAATDFSTSTRTWPRFFFISCVEHIWPTAYIIISTPRSSRLSQSLKADTYYDTLSSHLGDNSFVSLQILIATASVWQLVLTSNKTEKIRQASSAFVSKLLFGTCSTLPVKTRIWVDHLKVQSELTIWHRRHDSVSDCKSPDPSQRKWGSLCGG